MKLARLYSGKHEFISLHASFHGRSWGTLSITGNAGTKETRRSLCSRRQLSLPLPTLIVPNGEDPEECGRQCAKALTM